jgi:hypothetical protein
VAGHRSERVCRSSRRHIDFALGLPAGGRRRAGDLLGDGVNIAAPLESIAPEGRICISRSVYEAAANKLAVEFSDRWKQNLKNIPEPVHAYTFASNVTSPKRVRGHYLSRPVLVYGAGCAALLIVVAGVFVLSPSTKKLRSRSTTCPIVIRTSFADWVDRRDRSL